MATLFENIIARTIPATIEYEDDLCIAIRDIAPVAPVHILIIPKEPIPGLNALEAHHRDLAGHLMLVAKHLADQLHLTPSGYRVITNVGTDGGQTVPHLHFHLIGGRGLGGMTTSDSSGHGVTHANDAVTTQHAVAAADPAGTVFRFGSWPRNVLREAGLLILLAVGLAIGYNLMNPNPLAWVKKEYVVDTVSHDEIARLFETPGDTTVPAPTPQPGTAAGVDTARQATGGATATPTPTVDAPGTAPAVEAKPPAFQAQPGVIKEIGYDAFVKLRSMRHFLIDARAESNYVKGHIDGAVNIDGTEVQTQIQRMLAEIPRDRVILIYCDGGECELSHLVADVLKNFGFGPMFIYTGGWKEWQEKR